MLTESTDCREGVERCPGPSGDDARKGSQAARGQGDPSHPLFKPSERRRASLHLDIRCFDDGPPFLDFGFVIGGKCLRCLLLGRG
jgi:hypothetical protein